MLLPMSHENVGTQLAQSQSGLTKLHFRVWAPKAQRVDLVLEDSAAKTPRQEFHALEPEEGGYFSGSANAGAGARYWFRVNNNFYPDPASRFQPDGPWSFP